MHPGGEQRDRARDAAQVKPPDATAGAKRAQQVRVNRREQVLDAFPGGRAPDLRLVPVLLRERRADADSARVENGDDAVVAVDADSIAGGDLLGC